MKKTLNSYMEAVTISYDQNKFFLPPYAVLSMADLEEENFNAFEEKPVI